MNMIFQSKKILNQRIWQPACLLLASLAASSAFGSIVYQVEPFTLSDGYAVAGGTITTDGTLGILSASSILDYEISVTGLVPHVFSFSNPNARVGIITPNTTNQGRTIASATEISLPAPLDPANMPEISRVVFSEDIEIETPTRVDVGEASLTILQTSGEDGFGPSSIIEYEINLVTFDVLEDLEQEFEERATSNLGEVLDPLVIARVVPEPAAMTIWSIAIFTISIGRLRP